MNRSVEMRVVSLARQINHLQLTSLYLPMGFIWYFDIYINSLWLTMIFAVAHIFDGQAQRK
ncbi:hypothetical protein AO724_11085 [Aeromonas allosaccharophila]|nr:hypothetical protein AO724_11085 [Aeromonas allosaccharophila]